MNTLIAKLIDKKGFEKEIIVSEFTNKIVIGLIEDLTVGCDDLKLNPNRCKEIIFYPEGRIKREREWFWFRETLTYIEL